MSSHQILTLSDWDVLVQNILLPRIKPGTILTLSGPLGAGKTTLVQSLARALRIKQTPVSPTFSLLRSYNIKNHPTLKRLIHLDAYRIEKPEDMLTLGLEDALGEPGAFACIEWPENIAAWLERRKERIVGVKIEPKENNARLIHIS